MESDDETVRNPPTWGPDMEGGVDFRYYLTEAVLWSFTRVDLPLPMQAASLVMALQGGARECVQNVTAENLFYGGTFRGRWVDPVSYVLLTVHYHYASTRSESVLVLAELWNFACIQGETVHSLISRFNRVRCRASRVEDWHMSYEGLSIKLLSVLGVSRHMCEEILTASGNRLPTTENEFMAFTDLLQSNDRAGPLSWVHRNGMPRRAES